ncbi:MAG: DUF4177 domain-containing protein [Clostridia bacterium]|nr:DUF4177 domain-containing protein [Clostridia bacterium]
MYWEYKTKYVEVNNTKDEEPDMEKLQRILNKEGALGWELVNSNFCGNEYELEHKFWFVFKRAKKSEIEYLVNKGYDDEVLEAIYIKLNPASEFRRKLSIGIDISMEDIEFFCECIKGKAYLSVGFGMYVDDIMEKKNRESAMKGAVEFAEQYWEDRRERGW